jgi:hypothetical protein
LKERGVNADSSEYLALWGILYKGNREKKLNIQYIPNSSREEAVVQNNEFTCTVVAKLEYC